MRKIINGRMVLPDKILENGQLIIEEGIIIHIGETRYTHHSEAQHTFQWNQGYIWPGLLDIHIHGAGGSDTMDGTKESLSIIAKSLLKHGVTGFLATTVTTSYDKLKKVLVNIADWESSDKEAELLGVHLEGPWISPVYHGAQNPRFVVTPKMGDGALLYKFSKGKIKMVTLAPEVKNVPELIKELVALGVIVSIGHTDATYKDVFEAVKLGVSHITHTFNAMKPFHHREPGVIGAALTDKNLSCEIIADGQHVHPAAIKMLIEARGVDHVMLVSDSIRAVHMGEGSYELGGLEIQVKGDRATLEDGTLAGSMLSLNKAVMNTTSFADIPIWEAVKMASLNPAIKLGLAHDIGSIEVGKRANIIAVQENGDVNHVWVDGEKQL